MFFLNKYTHFKKINIFFLKYNFNLILYYEYILLNFVYFNKILEYYLLFFFFFLKINFFRNYYIIFNRLFFFFLKFNSILFFIYKYFLSINHLFFLKILWFKLKFSKKIILKFFNNNIFVSISKFDSLHFQKTFSMGTFLVNKSKYLDSLDLLRKKIEHNWYDEQIDLYKSRLKDSDKLSKRLNLKKKSKKKKNKYKDRYSRQSRKQLSQFKKLLYLKIYKFFNNFHFKFKFRYFFNLVKKNIFLKLDTFVSNFTKCNSFFYINLYNTCFSNVFENKFNYNTVSLLYSKIDRVHLLFKSFSNSISSIRKICNFFFLKFTFIQFVELNFSLKFGGTKFKKFKSKAGVFAKAS
jgi:hypothetical protein